MLAGRQWEGAGYALKLSPLAGHDGDVSVVTLVLCWVMWISCVAARVYWQVLTASVWVRLYICRSNLGKLSGVCHSNVFALATHTRQRCVAFINIPTVHQLLWNVCKTES